MILLPEQVVPFLQHDDPIVREQVLKYFRGTSNFGSLAADRYWAVIDRFGENEETLGFATGVKDLPQTDASLLRLIAALRGKSSEIFEFHYQHAARDMELAVLRRHRDDLLGCPQLLPHVREHLEYRLKLLDESPVDAWKRLMVHGRELARQYKFHFNPNQGDALIEAAARGGAEVCQRAMKILANKSAAEDWRETFAVRVLGLARYEPAIDALIEKLSIDADVLREEVNIALARIGLPRVIERIVDFYPGKPWHVRLFAKSSLPAIKRPESCEALLKLLGVELALASDPDYDDGEGAPLIDAVLLDLTELGSLAGLNESRRLIAESPDDPEARDLCESLLATAIMSGVKLPEEAAWRKRVESERSRIAAHSLSADQMFRGMREQWRKTGVHFPPDDRTDNVDEQDDTATWEVQTPVSNFEDRYVEPTRPIRNERPKVGRNDPCPCGSKKKYKKCCGQ